MPDRRIILKQQGSTDGLFKSNSINLNLAMTSVELTNPGEMGSLAPEKRKSLQNCYRAFKREVITQEQ